MQQKDYNGNPTMSWVHRDSLGLQEDGKAYDPFGSLIYNVQPPTGGPPPNMPFYGATYAGVSWSSFTNANNFSTGCMMDGVRADCNRVRNAIANGEVELGKTVISTTGTAADFFNAGFGGLLLPSVTSNTRWRSDPTKSPTVPPTLTPNRGGEPLPDDPSSGDNEGGTGHWETSFEVDFFLGAVFGGDPQKTSDPSSILKKFLAQNPDCAGKVQQAGDKLGLGSYLNTPFKITDTLPVYDQAGVIPNQADPRSSTPSVFFGELHPYWNAVTFTRREGSEIVRSGTYLGEGYHYSYLPIDGPPYFRRANNSDRVKGAILFDESLHNYFAEDHPESRQIAGGRH
jgi:hypothetical protein